jgi:enterochelin esterase-like enzyme
VFSQSGAFEADMLFYRSVIHDLIRLGEPPPLRIWMDVGRYEWLLEPNRRMHRLLREKGYNIAYREFNGGHNYRSWRNSIWQGLERLWEHGEKDRGNN